MKETGQMKHYLITLAYWDKKAPEDLRIMHSHIESFETVEIAYKTIRQRNEFHKSIEQPCIQFMSELIAP